MLNHTKKIKEIYEVIQKMIFYMIPEKWDKLYLYSSVIDKQDGTKTGELYFYYIRKGIIKKKPVNVYEIPNKFNVDEAEYLKLVKVLYEKIKQLREEFRKSETGSLWSNITIIIENYKFKVEYNYEDLLHSDFNSYERHIIWRYKYLNIRPEQMNKKDKENVVAFNTVKEEYYENEDNNDEDNTEIKKEKQPQKEEKNARKNQILLAADEIRKLENKKE